MEMTREDSLMLCLARKSMDEQNRQRAEELFDLGIDSSQFIRRVASHGVLSICSMNLFALDPGIKDAIPEDLKLDLAEQFRRRFFWQQIRYEVWKRVIRTLEGANLRALHFKGFALGKIVFEDILRRETSDIDLLVPQDDSEKFAMALAEEGFSQRSDQTVGAKNRYLKFFNHAAPFTATIAIDPTLRAILNEKFLKTRSNESTPLIWVEDPKIPTSANVQVELHHYLPGPPRTTSFEAAELIESGNQIAVDDLAVTILEPRYFLAFLCHHHAKHMSLLDHRFIYMLKYCCDVVETLRCFSSDLQTKEFLSWLEKSEIGGPVLSTIYHSCNVYGCRELDNMANMTKPENGGYLDHFHFDLFGQGERFRWRSDFKDRLFQEHATTMREGLELFERSRHKSLLMSCPKVKTASIQEYPDDQSCWALAASLSINEDKVPSFHPFGTHVLYGEPPESESALSARIFLCWDSDYLHLGIRVRDNKGVFGHKNSRISDNDFDMVKVYFRTGSDEIVRQYCLYLDTDSQRGATCRIPDGTKVPAHGSANHIGYSINFRFSFSELQIQPKHGLSIGFDVVLYDCNDRNEGLETVLSWAGGAWNPGYMYGFLRFTDHSQYTQRQRTSYTPM